MRRALPYLFFWWMLCLSSSVAQAQATHVVRAGQSLARIARRYHVSVADLAAANGLSSTAAVRPGQELRIPDANCVYVQTGDSLIEIAHDHGTTVAELVRLNHLRDGQALQVGQRLVMPGYEPPRGGAHGTASRWGTPRVPGTATFYRIATRTRDRVRLVDTTRRATRASIRRLGLLMRPRGARPRETFPNPPARLIELLARVSDHFGGHVVQIVSGYRHAGGYTRESSQHTHGHAIDIHVDGVPNTELRDYLRTFDRVGVGFYPRSSFVHFDVRTRSAYWVDWSRPGEAPQYQRRGESAPPDATTEERTLTGEGGDDAAEVEIEAVDDEPEDTVEVMPADPEPAAP
jgi:LysM repeat protein